MESDVILIEKKDHVATIVLNRPEKRNSLSPSLLLKLHHALEEFGKENEIRAIVIRGAGDKAFSAGYDISAIPAGEAPEAPESNPLDLAMDSIANFPYPIIAMLNGYAFGAGCELAITCDLRVGAEGIRMGMPPVKLGVVYHPSGIMRFINTIGLAKTKEVFFTGRYFDAQGAKERGMLDYLLPAEELEEFTYSLAAEIANHAPLSLKGTKKIINMLSFSGELSGEDLQEADRIVNEAFNSEDLKEAQRAFMEKRKPVFKGK